MGARPMFDKSGRRTRCVPPEREGRASLLYIDLHLVHEVTSPQAFEGLRLAGRRLRRPDRTLATADHNVPTDPRERTGLDAIRDELSRKQVEALERNCAEFGVPLYGMGSPRQGIVARDRAGARAQPARHHDRLRRLAYIDARRAGRAGDTDRHLRDRARARDAVPAPAPPEDDAHHLRRAKQGSA